MDVARFAPVGYQQIASMAGLSSLTPPASASMALLSAETANIRFRDDGVAPTASIGQLLIAGQQPFQYTGPLVNIQFIPVSGTPTLNVSYYKAGG